MATVIIPTSTTETSYTLTVELDGIDYGMRLHWSEREEAWYLDLYTASDALLIGALRVVADWPLLMHVPASKRPPGELLAVDTTGSGVDPGVSELGERVVLAYVEAAA